MNSLNFPTISSDSGFTKYLQDIRKYPNLTEQEEFSLAKKWFDYQDMNAGHALVLSHLKLVPKIASSFKGYGLAITDLVSEGNIGLLKALKNFNPNLGNRFSTYAMIWIRSTIQEYILKSWSLVKITCTKAHTKLFFGLRKLKKQLYATTGSTVSLSEEVIDHISNELHVTKYDVLEMNQRMTQLDYSLNTPVGEEGGEFLDNIVESRPNQENVVIYTDTKQKQMSMFRKSFNKLNEREKHIITERRLKEVPTGLLELSKVYNVSMERIRQIEERAIEKIKEDVGCL